MTRLDELLTAADSGALQVKDGELAELVRLVREERGRLYQRACDYASAYHAEMFGAYYDYASTKTRARRHLRASKRCARLVRGEPAFGGGK